MLHFTIGKYSLLMSVHNRKFEKNEKGLCYSQSAEYYNNANSMTDAHHATFSVSSFRPK